MLCDKCQNESDITVSAVLDGKFGNYCTNCFSTNYRLPSPDSASYSRDRDREEHEADLIQPWHKNGRPNKEYARMYPHMVDEMYNNEEKKEL